MFENRLNFPLDRPPVMAAHLPQIAIQIFCILNYWTVLGKILNSQTYNSKIRNDAKSLFNKFCFETLLLAMELLQIFKIIIPILNNQ